MQEGVVNHEAAKKAEAAGITVVMDRCILKELARLLSNRHLICSPYRACLLVAHFQRRFCFI